MFNRKNSSNRNRYNSSGNRGSNKSGGGSWGNDSRPQMHPATCEECNKSCEVPFKPNGRKPIYCRECFVKQEGGNDNSRFGGGRSDRSRSFDKPRYGGSSNSGNGDVVKELKSLNNKMEKILSLLTDLSNSVVIDDGDEEDLDEPKDMDGDLGLE